MPRVVFQLDKREVNRLRRKLRRLRSADALKIVRRAARAAARVVLAEAQRRAPVRSGALKRGLKIRALRRSRRRVGVAVRTGTRAEMEIEGDGYYPAHIHFGSRRRNLTAQPFLRDAAEFKRAEALSILSAELGRGIEELGRAA